MDGLLVLFDIDGTLLDTGGAGMAALKEASKELYGVEGPELDLAGSTDSGIVRQLFGAMEIEWSEERAIVFYERYLVRLEANMQDGSFAGRVFPGVEALLDRLHAAEATIGLLTGNIAGGAALKTRHYGLGRYFRFGAYGDDHHDRNELGPIALSRAEAVTGRRFAGSEAIVIGDTPKDIACGRAMGARTLCVATGTFTAGELRDHGADVVVEDFSDTAEVLAELQPGS
ncbi:MAG: HAD hydrolase-like protein [Akkermansiaceae bacterium]|nr:HAD hydrolase-like protein [Akkermansiaceae bacterium]